MNKNKINYGYTNDSQANYLIKQGFKYNTDTKNFSKRVCYISFDINPEKQIESYVYYDPKTQLLSYKSTKIKISPDNYMADSIKQQYDLLSKMLKTYSSHIAYNIKRRIFSESEKDNLLQQIKLPKGMRIDDATNYFLKYDEKLLSLYKISDTGNSRRVQKLNTENISISALIPNKSYKLSALLTHNKSE